MLIAVLPSIWDNLFVFTRAVIFDRFARIAIASATEMIYNTLVENYGTPYKDDEERKVATEKWRKRALFLGALGRGLAPWLVGSECNPLAWVLPEGWGAVPGVFDLFLRSTPTSITANLSLEQTKSELALIAGRAASRVFDLSVSTGDLSGTVWVSKVLGMLEALKNYWNPDKAMGAATEAFTRKFIERNFNKTVQMSYIPLPNDPTPYNIWASIVLLAFYVVKGKLVITSNTRANWLQKVGENTLRYLKEYTTNPKLRAVRDANRDGTLQSAVFEEAIRTVMFGDGKPTLEAQNAVGVVSEGMDAIALNALQFEVVAIISSQGTS